MQTKTGFVGYINLTFLLLLCFIGCDTGESTKSSDAFLKSLSIKNGDVELINSFDAKTTSYSVNVSYTTVLVTVYAETAHEKASLAYQPENSGGAIPLDVGNNSIEISVTAEDGAIQKYAVEINRAASDEKAINAFTIADNSGVIVGETIVVTVPYGTDVTKLSPVIQFSGKTVNPASGVEQNFSNPVMYTVTADDDSEQQYTVLVRHTASDTKEIYAFTIGKNTGAILGTNITITVPYGTDVTKLTPIILFSGKSISPESGVEKDFSSPITYTVTADDDSEQNYTVLVKHAPSDTKTITAFAIDGNQGVIVGETIVVTLPYGTTVTNLTPVIYFSGKSISPASGVEQDFSNSVTYTVTADDGSQRNYTVLIKHTASDTKELYAFSIGNNAGVISGTNITVTVPYGTDVTKLTPTIIFSGKSVSPASGVEQDFTNPVTYTVTADDSSTKPYIVTVIRQEKPSIAIEFTDIADEQIDLTKDSQNDLSRRNNDTLEISADDTILVFWFVDGAQKSGAGNPITIAAADYPVGVHYVTAMVYRNGTPYSNEVTFRVVE